MSLLVVSTGIINHGYRLWSTDSKLSTTVKPSLPGGSDGKESACNARDWSSIPGVGRSPGEGTGNPLQYSCLEKSMDRGAWRSPWDCKESDTTEQLPQYPFISHGNSRGLVLLFFLLDLKEVGHPCWSRQGQNSKGGSPTSKLWTMNQQEQLVCG